MSSVLDILSWRSLWDSWRERASQKTVLGKAAKPGLEPWTFGSPDGGHLLFPGLFGDFLEYRAVASRYCCFPALFCPHSQTKTPDCQQLPRAGSVVQDSIPNVTM